MLRMSSADTGPEKAQGGVKGGRKHMTEGQDTLLERCPKDAESGAGDQEE